MRKRASELKETSGISIQIPKALYLSFKGLAQENEVSIKFVLRRLIENAVITRQIPWPGSVQPVPTYDGTEQATKTDGRKHPVPPAA
jgi:hypothetical protein